MELLQFGEIRTPVIVAPPTKPEDKKDEKKAAEQPAATESHPPGNVTAAPTPA